MSFTHVFIHILFVAGKTIKTKNVLMVVDRSSNSTKTDTVVPGLVGRCCGYGKKDDKVVVVANKEHMKAYASYVKHGSEYIRTGQSRVVWSAHLGCAGAVKRSSAYKSKDDRLIAKAGYDMPESANIVLVTWKGDGGKTFTFPLSRTLFEWHNEEAIMHMRDEVEGDQNDDIDYEYRDIGDNYDEVENANEANIFDMDLSDEEESNDDIGDLYEF
jgi:hypothetical protein